MSEIPRPQVAIVDNSMGNLFSVKHACKAVGLETAITSSPEQVCAASAVILPGVGAFGDAMAILKHRGMDEALRQVASSGRPLMGICLGMQLLMQESCEFGRHRGLGILEGDVLRFERDALGSTRLKVPQVGWNQIQPSPGMGWDGTYLEGVPVGAFMYFVHSFYVRPADPGVAFSMTRYGNVAFCSSLRLKNVFACQFHPERSGPVGIQIYRNFAAHVRRSMMEVEHV